MDKVILFLHERKSKQLAPLQWESLYVAYTRVKRGDDIRVCYFGSDDSSDRSGLKHSWKLRRPELYDVWKSAYDDQGRWNDRKLREQAKRERTKLRRKLRRVTSITQVSLKKLKEWANILDVNVPYKPGTKRKTNHSMWRRLPPFGLESTEEFWQPEVITSRTIFREDIIHDSPRDRLNRKDNNNETVDRRRTLQHQIEETDNTTIEC